MGQEAVPPGLGRSVGDWEPRVLLSLCNPETGGVAPTSPPHLKIRILIPAWPAPRGVNAMGTGRLAKNTKM